MVLFLFLAYQYAGPHTVIPTHENPLTPKALNVHNIVQLVRHYWLKEMDRQSKAQS
ncbi:MAG: hypothetical protein ACLPX9_06975 [Rhodomicrobium sp.]